jgi:hypothetical protein
LQNDQRFKILNNRTQNIAELLQDIRKAQQDIFTGVPPALIERDKNELAETRAAFINVDVWKRQAYVHLDILESLRFPVMKERYERVARAHEKTFEWIFKDPQRYHKPWDNFVRWLEGQVGIYWIHGKAASGKSTLMRHIWNHEMTLKSLQTWSKGASLHIGTFFFWKSGVPEQRSHLGLLRSLLYEALSLRTDLIPDVFPEEWRYKSDLAAHDMKITQETWSLPRLKNAFEKLIGHANPHLKMCYFIDGLDEYEGEPEDMAQYFRDLSLQSNYAKFCLSSRPWPSFEGIFRNVPALRLQDLTHDDIQLYVYDKLGANDLMQQLIEENRQDATSLFSELLQKAAGVFLWVELVVKRLMIGLRNGDNISHLRRRLAALPPDLESLYEKMVKSIDPLYLEEASQIFQIFRASGHDMNIATLERAFRFSTYREALDLEVNRNLQTVEEMERMNKLCRTMAVRLNSRCMGLLEVNWILDDKEREPEMSIAIDGPLLIQDPSTGKSLFKVDNLKLPNEVWDSWKRVEPQTILQKASISREDDNIIPSSICISGVSPHAPHDCGAHFAAQIHSKSQQDSVIAVRERDQTYTSDPNLVAQSLPSPNTGLKRKLSLFQDCGLPDVQDVHNEEVVKSAEVMDKPSFLSGQDQGTTTHEAKRFCLTNRNLPGVRISGPAGKPLRWHRHPDPDYSVHFLHSSAMEYLESSKIWEFLLAQTKNSDFDPAVALLVALVIEVKTTNYIYEAPSIYAAGWEMLQLASQIPPPSAKSIAIELLEELDKSLMCHLDPTLSSGSYADHWSNYSPEWRCDETEARREWQGDLLSMSIDCHVDWYLEAKVALNPSLTLQQRPGLPLIAYALCFDLWAFTGDGMLVFVRDRILETLLNHGADPNQIYKGHTIWEYAIQYLHMINNVPRRLDQHALERWLRAFVIMLSYGADPHACCSGSCNAWASAVNQENYQTIAGFKMLGHGFLNDHMEFVHYPGDIHSEGRGDSSSLKQRHSLTTVVMQVFHQRGIKGADELLRVLEYKKRGSN